MSRNQTFIKKCNGRLIEELTLNIILSFMTCVVISCRYICILTVDISLVLNFFLENFKNQFYYIISKISIKQIVSLQCSRILVHKYV